MRYIVESNLPWSEMHSLIHGADNGGNVHVMKTFSALFLVDTPGEAPRVFYAMEHTGDNPNFLRYMDEVEWIDFNAVQENKCPSCLMPLIPQEQYDACHCGTCGFTWDTESMYFTKITKSIYPGNSTTPPGE